MGLSRKTAGRGPSRRKPVRGLARDLRSSVTNRLPTFPVFRVDFGPVASASIEISPYVETAPEGLFTGLQMPFCETQESGR